MKFMIFYGLTTLFFGIFLGLLCGCTLSINVVHTQGIAKDVVDENQAASPDIDTDISVPAVGT